MGYVSYSEDILTRHQSDVHDLLRRLEEGAVPEKEQYGSIPEFRNLVQKLGELLSDPAQPIAMRLMNLGSRVTSLEFDIKVRDEKNAKLAGKNVELNQRIAQLAKDIGQCRENSKAQMLKLKRAERDIQGKDQEIGTLARELASAKLSIQKLEMMLLASQVDVRMPK